MASDRISKTPEEYIAALQEPRRDDIAKLDRLIRELAPDLAPCMVFGMLGYGPYHYKYESGREGDSAHICLASQKNYISLYVVGLYDSCEEGEGKGATFQQRMPKANIGKGCVRFKRVADLDAEALRDLILVGAQGSRVGAQTD